jgi:hypothetical protein
VTLSLGLRYEYYGVQHSTDPSLDSNFYPGDGATVYERVRNGRVMVADESPVGGLYAPDRNNFAPRLGVAWDVFGDGRTSLRGGYGIGYERNFGNVTFEVIQNPPNYAVVSVFAPDLGLPFIPISASNFGPLAGEGEAVLPRTNIHALDPHLKTAYAHFWSASLERKLSDEALVSLDYSGSKGVDLYTIANMNRLFSGAVYLGLPAQGQPGADPENPLARLNRQYGNIDTRGNDGFSNYNSLTAQFEGEDLFHLGLDVTAAYTWAHSIDNLSSTFSESENTFNLGLLDPYDPRLDKGDADFDIRHRFVTSGVWDLPFAAKSAGRERALFGGWELTYIFEAQSGSPYSLFDCSHAAEICPRALLTGPLGPTSSDTPSTFPGEVNTGNRYVWLDLTPIAGGVGAYANDVATAAASAAYGDHTPVSDFGPFPASISGRNAFRGAGSWNVDGGVYKNLRITEKVELQLRAEMYNVANHANLYVSKYETDVSSSAYVPASRYGNRRLQFGAKLVF